MTISVPSTEQPHLSSGEPSHRVAWGRWVAGRPASQDYRSWLARYYWIANVLGIFAVILLIVPAAFSYMLGLYTAAGYYAVIAGHFIFSLNILRTYRKHYKAACACCEAQDRIIDYQSNTIEILHASLLKERDSRTTPSQHVRRGETAADPSGVVNGSAAVVDFPNPKGVA